MTQLIDAYEKALAEIETYGYEVKEVCLKLPERPTIGTFFSFFENPATGDMLCRTYMHGDETSEKSVSFVRVLNPMCLKLRNQALVWQYLENGVFMYRHSQTQTTREINEKNGVISLYKTRMLQRPI